MNARDLAAIYLLLTLEERFRLILAAGGRNDSAERERLVRTGQRLTVVMPDHAPYAHAFSEICHQTYVELLANAAAYLDALTFESGGHAEAGSAVAFAGNEAEQASKTTDQKSGEGGRRSAEGRLIDLALAVGFELRTRAEGWRLFCARLSVPPFLLWQDLPGFERVQRALRLTERAAFDPAGMLSWLNDIRSTETSRLTELSLTAAMLAQATEKAFRQRVQWWAGEKARQSS